MWKRLLKSHAVLATASWLVSAYLRLCFATQRVHYPEAAQCQALYDSASPCILAFWHGRMALLPFSLPDPGRTSVLISLHGDGELIARAVHRLGVRTLRGSSNRKASDPKGAKDRGGAKVLRAAMAELARGQCVAVTPDGPRGPAFKVQPGCLALAARSGLPIYPATFSCSRGITIRSWDHFLLPLPFGRVVFRMGEAVRLNLHADAPERESAGIALEKALQTLTREADAAVGRAPQDALPRAHGEASEDRE